MSEELIIYMLEKNFSSHPRDKLTQEQILYLNSQKVKLGEQKFKKLAIQARDNRIQLQQMTSDDMELYIMKQDATFNKQLSLLMKDQFNQQPVQQNFVNENQTDIYKQMRDSEYEVLDKHTQQLQQELLNGKKFQTLLQNQVREQGSQLQAYQKMFDRLRQTFLPELHVKFTDSQITDSVQTMQTQNQIVTFLCNQKSKFTYNSLQVLQKDCIALKQQLYSLTQFLQSSPFQINSSQLLFEQVENLLQQLSGGISYSIKFNYVGTKEQYINDTYKKMQHLQDLEICDFGQQNITPNKELFIYLIESFIALSNTKLLLKYFSQQNFGYLQSSQSATVLLDKLNKNKSVGSKAECISLKISKEDMGQFTGFMRRRLDTFDCVQFNDNTAFVYYAGNNIVQACKTYGLIGKDVKVFVANQDDATVMGYVK